MRHLVILGGGYGGLRIIHRLLAMNLPDDVQLTLVERMPHHCLKTEYYALAAGTIPDSAIRVAFPEHPRLRIVYDTVTHIDLDARRVEVKEREAITYDYLVIGLGSEDKYHGVPGAEEHTLSIQTMERTRQTYQALNNLEAHSRVAVVGGGLSGVELASELRESRPDLKIQLYDRGESILSPFPKRLRDFVSNWFYEHQVELIHKANITRVEPNLLYNHDRPIEADAIVWTAGVQPNHVVRALPVQKDEADRIMLSEHHFIPQYPEVFVVGDCASLPHAPSAQLAEAQGDQIALVLESYLFDQPLPTLGKIKLKGVLGSLGKKQGFGVMGETTLIGRVPRLLKSGVLWMYKFHSGS